MKRTTIVAALAIAAGVCQCAAASEHCIYDAVPLDGAWEMAYRSNAWDSAECPQFKGVAVAKAVPGFWEDMVPALRAAGMKDGFRINPAYVPQTIPITKSAKCTTLPNIYGCFLYRRRFTLEKLPQRPASLAFDCVRNQVHAWVNGRFVAFRQGFSTPFELPIPPGALREGENEIVLAVSNNPNKGYNGSDVSGLTTRALFESTGGIDGRLELRFARNGLRDVYVTTAKDLKTFTVHVNDGRVERVEGEYGKFGYEISDAAGKVVAKGEGRGDFTLPTKGFSFWSPENPVRYTLTLTTPEGAYSQKFGIRRLVPDGERMRLNGEPAYLRGVTEHCYFAETVHLPRDVAYYRTITAKRKELGFNFLRFHTFVPPEEYLEAMDELGMLVHIESPNFVTLDEYDAIVRFARRHPCVVAYCTGNETWIDGRAEKYLASVAKLVHDKTDSLFTPMSAMRNVEYMVKRGKDTAGKPFLHVPSRMARLAAHSDYFTSYQLGAVSYNSLNGASAETVDAWGDAYCGKPRTMHETCIDGSFCDITLEKDYPKGSPVTKAGVFSEVRRHLADRGLLDRAPAYVRNSCEWMRRIRKFTFEKVRASRRIVGYDFLGDIDSRWHTFGYSDGIMDEFYRLKHGETVENVRRYNSAAVLLADLGSDFNVTAGEKKRVKFSVSNFAGDAKDAVVRVSVVACRGRDDSRAETQRRGDGLECVWRGECKVRDVKNGEVVGLGEFEVAFPASDAPRKYLLRASFAGGSVSAENEWEMYAFPKGGPRFVAAADGTKPVPPLRIASDISRDDLIAAMERGERALLLGRGPFKASKTSYRIGLAGRCAGNYATVIKPGHPALAGLPHEGFCGWQFRRLMEGGAAVQLEAGVPFDPIVEVASSDKFLIRQAMLFEYKVGEGRLLVCSFKFDDGDPAAEWLKSRLAEYAASDAFNPAQSLTPEQLRAVIDAPLFFSAEANTNKAMNPDDPASYVRSAPPAAPAHGAMLDLQPQIDAAAAKGGGTVCVPAGEHETLPFELKSNVTLRFEDGAKLLASTNIADYATRGECPVFIYAGHATNVAIVGKGTIDGRGGGFRETAKLRGEDQPKTLPLLMRFSRCRNVRLEGFHYTNPGSWACHLRNCDGVKVKGTSCFNYCNRMNDGLDIESCNVTVEDCDFYADDDSFCFKAESDKSFPVTNVVVRNCRMGSICNAIKFGTGSYNAFRDITIENCELRRSPGAWRWDWRKNMPGVTNRYCGIAGLALEVVDGGRMENVTIRNIKMEGYMTPIFIRHSNRHGPKGKGNTYLRNILIENVTGTCESRIASSITGVPARNGSPARRPRNITLRNISIVAPGGGTAKDAAGRVPEKDGKYPEAFMFDRTPLPAYGFYVRHADAVHFENVTVTSSSSDARKPFAFEDCADCTVKR